MRSILLRGTCTSAIAGTVLVVMDRWPAVTGGATPDHLKAALCYLVAFPVSVDSSILAERAGSEDEIANEISARLAVLALLDGETA